MGLDFVPEAGTESTRSVLSEEFDTSVWGVDAREIWKAMRAQGSVVWPNPDMVVTTSTTAVRESLHDPNVFSSNPSAGYFGSDAGAIPLQVDPPLHSRFRKMLDPMFTPKKMAAREGQVAEIVNRLIDRFIDRGEVDFSTEFAVPFPSEMFLSLMGLPLEELSEFLEVKEAMIRPVGQDDETRRQAQDKASGWIVEYINSALAKREKEMTDDILGTFLQLERDGHLTRAETLNICILFLPAGLDTVTDTLECSFAFLAGSPSHQKQLADDPEASRRAVEELLRFETPVPVVSRVAMTDASLDGCPVARGTRVRSLLSIANHDPEIFDNPDSVDFDRETNPHISFGAGVHRCLGSHLARIELRVAMREWHRRIPTYRLADGAELVYQRSLREIQHLPLVFPAGS